MGQEKLERGLQQEISLWMKMYYTAPRLQTIWGDMCQGIQWHDGSSIRQCRTKGAVGPLLWVVFQAKPTTPEWPRHFFNRPLGQSCVVNPRRFHGTATAADWLRHCRSITHP